MNLFTLIPLIAFLFNGFVWTYIFAQKKQNPVNKAFLIYASSLAFWLLYAIIIRQPIPRGWIVPFMKIGSVAWLPISFFFLNFTYVFLDKKKDLVYYTLLFLTIGTIVISFISDLVIKRFQIEYWGIDELPGKLFIPLVLLVVVIPAFYSLFLIGSKIKDTQDENFKHSLLLIFIGSSITLIIGLASKVIIPYILNEKEFFQFTESGTAVQSVFIFRSVIKYRLFTPGVEEIAKDLFARMQDAVLILNTQGYILQLNNAAQNLFSLKHSKAKGKHITNLINDYDYDTNYQNLEKEIILEGKLKILSLTQSVVSVGDLELGKILIVRDITVQKQVENELRTSQNQLRALSASLQSAREEERTHIAREIHDELGQILTAVKMDITLLSESILENENISNSVILAELQSIVKLVDDSIQTIRNIASELRPDVLDHLGLIDAIEWQAKEFQGRNKIKCSFKSELKNLVMDKDRTTAIFRIFQETLTNIVRHANSTKVDIVLEKYNGNLLLRVEDNGKGIAESEINNIKSIGIIGMKERSFILGGEINIKGKKGKGTVITLKIPFTENVIESIN